MQESNLKQAASKIIFTLALKVANKNLQQTTLILFTFIFRRKLGLIFHVNPLLEDSLETSSQFSLKNNEKIFMNVACCSRGWRFKG